MCIRDRFGTSIARGGLSPDIDGNTAHDDGGEELGQCEGFPIEGTEVEISLKNEGTDAVCLDEFQLFGGSEVGRTSTRSIPFIQCNPTCNIWGENRGWFSDYPQSYCEGDSGWQDWREVKAVCSFSNSTETVKKIALMTCPGEASGSNSQIKVVIRNIDGEQCTTDALKNTPIHPGDYIESSNIGHDCLNTPIKNGEVKVSFSLLFSVPI